MKWVTGGDDEYVGGEEWQHSCVIFLGIGILRTTNPLSRVQWKLLVWVCLSLVCAPHSPKMNYGWARKLMFHDKMMNGKSTQLQLNLQRTPNITPLNHNSPSLPHSTVGLRSSQEFLTPRDEIWIINSAINICEIDYLSNFTPTESSSARWLLTLFRSIEGRLFHRLNN